MVGELRGRRCQNALEEQVSVSNQNVASAAWPNFLAARALVKQARSAYFPTVAAAPSITNSRPSSAEFGGFKAGGGSSGSSSSGSTVALTSFTGYSLPFDASWQPDFWGRIRNTVNSNVLAAQASAADLENVRLTVQAEVAVDYFELRAQDALKQLFDQTVAGYRDSLDVTQTQFRAGIASDEAVAQAATQLQATQAADTDLGIQRAQFEHALATLVGKPAAAFELDVKPLDANPPSIPYAVPAQLLERRPDVAEQEERRLVAAANAQIGIARAAFYPNVTLSGSAGLGSSSIVDWFTWPSRFWSVGPTLAETLFDGGLAAPRNPAAVPGAVRPERRELSPNGFDRVSTGGGQSRGAAHLVARNSAASGGHRFSSKKPGGRERSLPRWNRPLVERDHGADHAAEQSADSRWPAQATDDRDGPINRSARRRMGCLAVAEAPSCGHGRRPTRGLEALALAKKAARQMRRCASG